MADIRKVFVSCIGSKILLCIRTVVEHFLNERSRLCIFFLQIGSVFIGVIEQIVGVASDRVGILIAVFLTVNDLSCNCSVHILRSDTTLKDIVFTLDRRLRNRYVKLGGFGAVRDREVHICGFACSDRGIKLHVEVDRDVALERKGVTGNSCAYAVVKVEYCGVGHVACDFRQSVGSVGVLAVCPADEGTAVLGRFNAVISRHCAFENTIIGFENIIAVLPCYGVEIIGFPKFSFYSNIRSGHFKGVLCRVSAVLRERNLNFTVGAAHGKLGHLCVAVALVSRNLYLVILILFRSCIHGEIISGKVGILQRRVVCNRGNKLPRIGILGGISVACKIRAVDIPVFPVASRIIISVIGCCQAVASQNNCLISFYNDIA